jgi:hypothetical protein
MFQVRVMRLLRKQETHQAMHQGRGAMSERDELADLIYRGQYSNPHSQKIQPLQDRPEWEIAAHFRAAGEVMDAGWVKLTLDDATVERVAEAMWNQEQPVKSGDRPTWDEILNDPGWEGGVVRTREVAKVALAAAVEATS